MNQRELFTNLVAGETIILVNSGGVEIAMEEDGMAYVTWADGTKSILAGLVDCSQNMVIKQPVEPVV